jgi:hypothetical protein
MAETKKEANKKKKMRSENGHKTAEKKISDDKVKSRRPKTLNNWSEDRMKLAVEECQRGDSSINEAARAWCVPRSTLQLRVKGQVAGFRSSAEFWS